MIQLDLSPLVVLLALAGLMLWRIKKETGERMKNIVRSLFGKPPLGGGGRHREFEYPTKPDDDANRMLRAWELDRYFGACGWVPMAEDDEGNVRVRGGTAAPHAHPEMLYCAVQGKPVLMLGQHAMVFCTACREPHAPRPGRAAPPTPSQVAYWHSHPKEAQWVDLHDGPIFLRIPGTPRFLRYFWATQPEAYRLAMWQKGREKRKVAGWP